MSQVTRQEHGEGLTITEHSEPRQTGPERLDLVSHSMLFYWWPVWLSGFIMAFLTWVWGEPLRLGDHPAERIHPNAAIGVTYVCILLGVIIFTNVVMRGLVSGIVILGALFLAVLFAWLGWWQTIIEWLLPNISIHLNFGFYIVTSTVLFVAWAFTFFIFDRLSYWRIVPGQVTQEHLIGGGEQTYDANGLRFEEFHDDPFRHYLLGLGTGDLKMTVPGGEEFYLPNVLFANSKVSKVQDLIKRKPD